MRKTNTYTHTHTHTHSHTHLTGSTIHWTQVFGKLFSDSEIHVEVFESGESADPHGPCGWIMLDLFGGLQQTHNLPESKINIWQKKRRLNIKTGYT